VPPQSLYQSGGNYPQSRARLCSYALTTWRAARLVTELINNAASTSFPEFVLHGSSDAITAGNLSEPKHLKSEQQQQQSAIGTS
jgi:hypothetical protein